MFSKLEFHPLFLATIAVAFCTGYFKYMMGIFSIVMIHELGHIFFAAIFKRKVNKIILLPFGGLTNMDGMISEDIFEDELIAVGGIFFQTILGFALAAVYEWGFLSDTTFRFLNTYNMFIIAFNLLPICPLDGYKIVKLAIEFFVPYSTAYRTAVYMSIVVLTIAVVCNFTICQNNLLVFIFLAFMIIREIRMRPYLLSMFYLERMNGDFSYKRVDIENRKSMYKNRVNYIRGVHEKDYLKRQFTPKTN